MRAAETRSRNEDPCGRNGWAQAPRMVRVYNAIVARWLAFAVLLALAGSTAQPAAADDPEALLRSAATHLQQGDAAQAIHDLKAALAANPRLAAAHMLLGQAYLAQHSVEMAADAKAELQQALDLDPHLLWAHFYLAKIYLDLGRNQQAKEQLEQGLKEQPNIPHFLSLLGEADRKLGDPQASIELNHKALEVDSRMTPAHYYAALAYLDLKQEDAAIRELEAAIRSPYIAPEMCTALASLYAKRQRFAEAEALDRKAIALDATRPETYLNLARLYNSQGASDKALTALGLVFPEGKTFPADAYYEKLQADAAFEEGRAYQAKKMTSQALAAYLRCLDLDAGNGAAHRQLAELYLKKGDTASARDHADAAEKLGTPVEPALRQRISQAR